MVASVKAKTVAVALLVGLNSPAAAQISPDFVPDPHFEWDLYFGDPSLASSRDGGDVKDQTQPPEQQKKNRQRLSQDPSDEALAVASRKYLPDLYELSAEAGAIGKAALSNPAKIAEFRSQLKQVGLDSNNLAHVVTAYVVSINGYEERGRPGIEGVPQGVIDRVREQVENALIVHLPPSASALQIRAVIDETRAEFLFVDEIVRLSAAESAENRQYIRGFLLERSKDYAMFR